MPLSFKSSLYSFLENLCKTNSCEHGICVDTLFEQKCICEEGWAGERCDSAENKCAEDPCRNGGKCIRQITSYKCECSAGYFGKNCQHLVDHCISSPCSNNGTCTNLGPSYVCTCPLGYEGVHCEHNIDECKYNKCNEVGTQNCEDGINSFSCICKPGYEGSYCEQKIDQCKSSPCRNNGSCVDVGASFQCNCAEGWTGQRCEKQASVCMNNPCHNNGHCVPTSSGYFCVCPEGVSGKDCEVAPNRCMGEPCLNGGVCGDFGSRLQCTCNKSYRGDGCQYIKDLCGPDTCQNGGSCFVENGKFNCLCPSGFTGEHCETNINDCLTSPCPVNSQCIDQINGVYCRCPFNKMGSSCEKDIDEDYDFHFYDSLRPAVVSTALPFSLTGSEFTLSFWVRFDNEQGKGDVLTLYNSSHSNYSLDPVSLLEVNDEGFTLNLFADKPTLHLHFPTSQRVNNGRWNHLVFMWSSHHGSYSLIWNSIRLFDDSGYGVGKQLNINAIISLGSDMTPLEGSITRVHMWDRVISFEDEVPILATSCQESEPSLKNLLVRFSGYTVIKGKVERLSRSTCGRENVKLQEESEIIVENCPPDQYLLTSQREINVTWQEPMFLSRKSLIKIEKNLKPGQILTWGEYDVLYVAYDNASRSSRCSFKIIVAKEHCPVLQEPINGIQACEAWGPQLRYKACSIECRDGFEFSRPPSYFYTCSSDGEWRPRQDNKIMFRYPQCTKTIPATRVVVIKLAYPATTMCSDASKTALRSKLMDAINEINRKWTICSAMEANECIGVRIDIECVSDVSRTKREAHSFRIRVELPVKRTLVVDSVSGQKLAVADVLQDAILTNGAFNMEKVLPNGRPDLNTFQLLDQFHCQPGQIPVDDVCVPCAPGTYYSASSSECEPCAEGTYQPLSGRSQCFTCPSNQVTAGMGAISEDECKDNCKPGHYLDLTTSKCTACGLGFYQPKSGSFKCISCGIGKITLSNSSTTEEQCKDECPDGEQLSMSGVCQPCAFGFYRSRGENKQCVQCPPGTTTETTSSTRREQCNTPLCRPGQYLVKETKHCQFCQRGTFQDVEQQTSCKLCPVDHTTAAEGATAESQCYNTNQCTTGEDDCSWHALCIDLPDQNDIPSYECKCKPGYIGNGTYCKDACNNFCLNDGVCKKNPVGLVECVCKDYFTGERCEERVQQSSQKFTLIMAAIGGVVVVLVAIVSIVYMISCRFNRLDEIQPEKSHIDDLQNNFIYGPPIIDGARPVGYYYEDDDEFESKSMYVTEKDSDDNIRENTLEQRIRTAQQHMYRPSMTQDQI
ncbi:unnamed protein product [Auanema sp. JU1783]|nr:unnamed protein product [Auanema sp. JU1783]